MLLTPFAPIGAGMVGSGFGALAGGAISEKLGGSYELGANIGSIVGGTVGGFAYDKISALRTPNNICSTALDARSVEQPYFPNGERIATTKQIRQYKKMMSNKGINVSVDKKNKILIGNKAAGFDYSNGTIVIKKKPGLIDLYHEGYHAEQYLRIGKESYIGLGSLARESYVFNRIMENSYLFNESELQGAINYMERLLKGI